MLLQKRRPAAHLLLSRHAQALKTEGSLFGSGQQSKNITRRDSINVLRTGMRHVGSRLACLPARLARGEEAG